MTCRMESPIWILLTLISPTFTLSYSQPFCSIFQPYKVIPDNAKFQIGGPFPLHTDDCVHVRPQIVQELIAVQWALSHWNQNPQNANFKLAMFAADTCSRDIDGVGQTVTILNEAGFFTPKECKGDGQNGRVPLGLIMPAMPNRALNSMKSLLGALQLPVITYSTSTAQTLFDAHLDGVFSTAITMDHYVQTVLQILKQLNSNYISIIYSDLHISKATLDKQISILEKSDLSISEIFTLENIPKSKFSSPSSSDIVLILTSKKEFHHFLSSMNTVRKFFIIPSITGEHWTNSDISDILNPKSTPTQLLILQQASLFDTNQFRAYFLDILRNNYQSYALLATYMKQVYNCTLNGEEGRAECAKMDSLDLLDGYTHNGAVESAVLATYTLAELAKAMTIHPDTPCAKPGSACFKTAWAYLKKALTYTFGPADPEAYGGLNLGFGEDNVLRGLRMEGLYGRWENDELRLDIAVNYSRSGEWGMKEDLMKWKDGNAVRSWCPQWNSACRKKSCTVAERTWIQKSGQLYLMGQFDMRKYDAERGRCNSNITDIGSLTMPAAFVYTLETIGQKYPDLNLLPNVELGGILVDTCHNPIFSVQSAISTSNHRCITVTDSATKNESIFGSTIAAVVSGQKGASLDLMGLIFSENGGIGKPLIGTGPNGNRGQSGFTDLMPTFQSQARVILDLLIHHGWDYVSVLVSEHDSDCMEAYQAFRRLVEMDDQICISDVIQIKDGSKFEWIKNAAAPATPVVLVFSVAHDAKMYLKWNSYSDSARPEDRPVFIFVGDSQNWNTGENGNEDGLIEKWEMAKWGSISIQPQQSVNEDFRIFLSTINPKRLPEEWFIAFWQDYFKCAVRPDGIGKYQNSCTGNEKLEKEIWGRMSREGYFIMAMEKLIFALDAIYKIACPEQKGLCDRFFQEGYHDRLIEMMKKTAKSDDQFVIYNYRPKLGRTGGAGFVEIGNWSINGGLKFKDTLIWYDSDGKANVSLPQSTCRPPLCRCKLENDFFKKPIQSALDKEDQTDQTDQDEPASKGLPGSGPFIHNHGLDLSSYTIRRDKWKNEPWSYIFLVLTTILLLSAVLVLGLVCLKLCYRTVKGNQSLGIFLLCGVILLYCSAYFFIFDPCELICRLRYICHSLAYSICFGVMIAKAVQLKNSETLGFTGRISYWNYWLLLFFIVTVQFGLNMQWAVLRDPVIVSFFVQGDPNSQPSIILNCSWSSEEFLASHVYSVLLLTLALFLSMMNRNVKRNYKETRWLMYTSLLCAPVWMVWMVAYAWVPDPFKDTVVVMQVITCGTVVLCFMFGPKLYILLSYEPIRIEYPTGYKLDLGHANGNGASAVEKNNVVEFKSNHDFDGVNFGDMDGDEDGRGSVVSSTSANTKSTSLSHTLSSASSITTASDDSTSPVYQAIVRKKLKMGRISRPSETGSPPMVQRRDEVLGETVSSVH